MEAPRLVLYRDARPVALLGNWISLSVSRRINQADRLTVDGLLDMAVQLDDVLELTDQGTVVGRYQVDTIEPAVGENGEERLRITAQPVATHILAGTGMPGGTFIDGVDMTTALNRVVALTNQQWFNRAVLSYGLVTAPNFTPSSTKDRDALTALEALPTLLHAYDARWRCRADYVDEHNPLAARIDVGLFGVLRPLVIDSSVKVPLVIDSTRVYGYTRLSRSTSTEDYVTDVFAEGGTYYNSDGDEMIVTLIAIGTGSLIIPDGYTRHTALFPDNRQYTWLSRNRDDTGAWYSAWQGNVPVDQDPSIGRTSPLRRRFRRIRIESIVPVHADYFPPSATQTFQATQDLVYAAANYLDHYHNPISTWSVEFPYSWTGLARVGDRVHLHVSDTQGNYPYTGAVYLVGHDTTWGAKGEVTSELELSTVLESLADPLSESYAAQRASRPLMAVYSEA